MFLRVALCLRLLVLTIDSYFVVFIRLYLSAQKCAHQMAKILFVVDSSEILMPSNIVPITLQLALIGFSPLGILSFLKMPVNLNQ